MLARQPASNSPWDEPQQRGVGWNLSQTRHWLLGHGEVHLHVQGVHKGAAEEDQDNCSAESFLRPPSRSLWYPGCQIFFGFPKKIFQDEAVDLACTEWEYDKSESGMDTLVSENNWVCQNAPRVQEIHYLGQIGLILGVFVFRWLWMKSMFFFSLVADIFGRKICFFTALLSAVLFTLLQIPSSSYYRLFCVFTVTQTTQQSVQKNCPAKPTKKLPSKAYKKLPSKAYKTVQQSLHKFNLFRNIYRFWEIWEYCPYTT